MAGTGNIMKLGRRVEVNAKAAWTQYKSNSRTVQAWHISNDVAKAMKHAKKSKPPEDSFNYITVKKKARKGIIMRQYRRLQAFIKVMAGKIESLAKNPAQVAPRITAPVKSFDDLSSLDKDNREIQALLSLLKPQEAEHLNPTLSHHFPKGFNGMDNETIAENLASVCEDLSVTPSLVQGIRQAARFENLLDAHPDAKEAYRVLKITEGEQKAQREVGHYFGEAGDIDFMMDDIYPTTLLKQVFLERFPQLAVEANTVKTQLRDLSEQGYLARMTDLLGLPQGNIDQALVNAAKKVLPVEHPDLFWKNVNDELELPRQWRDKIMKLPDGAHEKALYETLKPHFEKAFTPIDQTAFATQGSLKEQLTLLKRQLGA